jgi:hypothetical protein
VIKKHTLPALLVGILSCLVLSTSAFATTVCRLTYSLEGWSAIYKVARGTGTIRCEDGQSAIVAIVAHGGGFTGGTQDVENGVGRFSHTVKVEDLFRTYIEFTGHAGVGSNKAVEARAMFAGTKRLSLAGSGSGIGLGFAFGGFSIRPQ